MDYSLFNEDDLLGDPIGQLSKPSTNLEFPDQVITADAPPSDPLGLAGLKAAIEQDRSRRLGTGILGSLAGGVATMTGTRPNDQVWKDIASQSDQSVRDFGIARKVKGEMDASALARTARDPNSEESRAIRQFLAQGGVQVPESLTAEKAQKYMPFLKGAMEANQKTADRAQEKYLKQLEYGKKAEEKTQKELDDEKQSYVPGVGRFPSVQDRQKFSEMAYESLAANNDVNNLLEIGQKGGYGSRFDIGDRAKANVFVSSLVGKLRVPMTGPGALTEPERQALIKTIGNPTEFWSIPEVAEQKLRSIKKILNQSLDARAKAFMVDPSYQPKGDFSQASSFSLPDVEKKSVDSGLESRIQRVLDANPGSTREQVIESLKKAGKL